LKHGDPLYYLWKGFILFYILFSRLDSQLDTLKYLVQDCEKSLTVASKLNPESTAALYALLKLSLYTERNQKRLKIASRKKPQDYGLKIQKVNKYLGYVAWAEIYLNRKDKRELGLEVLQELIKENPEQPYAYLRLWQQYCIHTHFEGVLEISEKLFIYGTGFNSFEVK